MGILIKVKHSNGMPCEKYPVIKITYVNHEANLCVDVLANSLLKKFNKDVLQSNLSQTISINNFLYV